MPDGCRRPRASGGCDGESFGRLGDDRNGCAVGSCGVGAVLAQIADEHACRSGGEQ